MIANPMSVKEREATEVLVTGSAPVPWYLPKPRIRQAGVLDTQPAGTGT